VSPTSVAGRDATHKCPRCRKEFLSTINQRRCLAVHLGHKAQGAGAGASGKAGGTKGGAMPGKRPGLCLRAAGLEDLRRAMLGPVGVPLKTASCRLLGLAG
jgi:hypothetical protein